MEHTLAQLANMPTSLLWDVLGEDSERWFELVEYKNEVCPDFTGWLATEGLSRTPAAAALYYVECSRARHDDLYAQAALQAANKAQTDNNTFQFYTALKERMAEYRNKPYKPELEPGDYICILPEGCTDATMVSEHLPGIIRAIHKTIDKVPVFYTLSLEDTTMVDVPAERTYRIY